MVDISAPGFVKVHYQYESREDEIEKVEGTSFSSPIVTGVAATIMSEFPYLILIQKECLNI